MSKMKGWEGERRRGTKGREKNISKTEVGLGWGREWDGGGVELVISREEGNEEGRIGSGLAA